MYAFEIIAISKLSKMMVVKIPKITNIIDSIYDCLFNYLAN